MSRNERTNHHFLITWKEEQTKTFCCCRFISMRHVIAVLIIMVKCKYNGITIYTSEFDFDVIFVVKGMRRGLIDRNKNGKFIVCTHIVNSHERAHRIVRKTTIICLGRQQTHKTFRFISHHRRFLSLKLFFLFILFNRLIHLTIIVMWYGSLFFLILHRVFLLIFVVVSSYLYYCCY